jgi:hypothetical protein
MPSLWMPGSEKYDLGDHGYCENQYGPKAIAHIMPLRLSLRNGYLTTDWLVILGMLEGLLLLIFFGHLLRESLPSSSPLTLEVRVFEICRAVSELIAPAR